MTSGTRDPSRGQFKQSPAAPSWSSSGVFVQPVAPPRTVSPAKPGGPVKVQVPATPKLSSTAPVTLASSTVAVTSIPAPQIGSNSQALSQLADAFANLDGPPPFLVPIYKHAGREYHVPWQVLAAINSIETNYGRDLSTSSAGAVGWMQFMPETWRQYAVDADHNGKTDPYNPRDAIFTAARYLDTNGARKDIRRAVFAYNHATWYVNDVMLKAQAIKDTTDYFGHAKGYALPLAPKYLRQLGRTDDGVDIETAPDGALVYSMTPGVVSAVASDPGGFGPNYPVVGVGNGPLKGKYIYYGHVAISIVDPGQRVRAGQPIAIMGHTGDAASLGHGHIEIGFSDFSGNPLDHHGATAETPAGASMRQFLVALSASFHVHNS